MADQGDDGENTEEDGKAGGGKKKLIIIILGALLVLGGGGGAAAYFMGLFGGDEKIEADAEGAAESEDGVDGAEADETADTSEDVEVAEAEDGADQEPSTIAFVTMPDVLVNLNGGGKRMRFLKLKVALETANDEVAAQVEALMPRIMDSFQIYLRALSVDEVRGSAGLAQLKDELMARVNHAVHPARVDDILVREMLVQ